MTTDEHKKILCELDAAVGSLLSLASKLHQIAAVIYDTDTKEDTANEND